MLSPEVVFFEGLELWVISQREQESSQRTQEGEDVPEKEKNERESMSIHGWTSLSDTI